MNKLKSLVYWLFLLAIFFVSLPLLGFTSLVIFLDSGGPIFYKQKRTGYKEKAFTLIKFRTMRPNAHTEQSKFRKLNEAQGPVFKIYNDPRFTKVGKILSHTGIDELPQLINIVRGEMAIVGPRPLPIDESKALKSWQKARYDVKPGIVSPWVVNGYHSKSFDEWMYSDIVYTQAKSIVADLFLLFRAGLFFCELLIKSITRK